MYNVQTHKGDKNKIEMFEFKCRNCGGRLYLNPRVLSKNGKKIPLNVNNNEPHNCPNQPAFAIECRACGDKINFDSTIISSKGRKKIPLNASNLDPHDCVSGPAAASSAA